MVNKSENYELALSTTTLIPQSIFNNTEVNLSEKQRIENARIGKLPKILKHNTTYSSLKSNTTLLALEDTRPKSSWNNFLKSIRNLGNFSRETSVSTEMFESIKKKVEDKATE